MTLAETKAVELIRLCGYEAMADEVASDPYLLRKGLSQASRSGLTGERERPLLKVCLEALGGFKMNSTDMAEHVRRKVEGRRKYKSLGQK